MFVIFAILLLLGIVGFAIGAEEEHTVLIICALLLVVVGVLGLLAVAMQQNCAVISAETIMLEAGEAQTTSLYHCKGLFDNTYYEKREVIVFEPVLPIEEVRYGRE